MKTTLKFLLVSCLWASGTVLKAQDIDINIVSQENGVNDGFWTVGAPNCTILITMCNNDGGTLLLPPYKIRPLLSVPGSICSIAPSAQQVLPPGWTILTNDGQSIRFSNGTDMLPPGECREFSLKIIPTVNGGPGTFLSTVAWGNGVAPGNVSGPQTVGNDPLNDNSTTAAVITTTLPISLLSLNAVKEGKNCKLTWVTSFEQNASHFDVEYSRDGTSWSKVGTVKANGNTTTNSTYTFVHTGLVNGANLYRIRSVDYDTRFKNSGTVSVTLNGKDPINNLSIFPNPAKSYTSISYTSDYIGKAQVVITDVTGKRVNALLTVLNTGTNSIKLNTQALGSGTYTIALYAEDGTKLGQPQRLIVVN